MNSEYDSEIDEKHVGNYPVRDPSMNPNPTTSTNDDAGAKAKQDSTQLYRTETRTITADLNREAVTKILVEWLMRREQIGCANPAISATFKFEDDELESAVITITETIKSESL